MKNISKALAALMMVLLFTACFKEYDYTFDEVRQVEFEEAVRLNPAPGTTFPIINVTRTTGTRNVQINLIGKHLPASQDLTISVDTAIWRLLSTTTIRAVEGTHFNLNGGRVTMKADTSFTVYRLNILNPGATANRQALVVLRLDGADGVAPAENYRRVGFRINLQ